MFKIYLKCLFLSEAQRQSEDLLDNDTPLNELEEREVTFYSIAALSPYHEERVEYTNIVTGSTTFTTRLKRNEIEKIIEQYYAVSN